MITSGFNYIYNHLVVNRFLNGFVHFSPLLTTDFPRFLAPEPRITEPARKMVRNRFEQKDTVWFIAGAA